tara:strand:+ start:507 stop:1037 length:531 start_codon:yes stop_codon:yes gene_type:complete
VSSVLKVDQIQLSNGNTPTIGDLGLNDTHSVLQTLHTSTTTFTTCSTTSYSDISGMSLTITPTKANSLIQLSGVLCAAIQSTASQVDVHGRTRILRSFTGDSTEVYVIDLRTYDFNGGSIYVNTGLPFMFIDQPNTTLAVTYKFQGKEVSAGCTSIDFNAEAENRCSFIIQEIAVN